MAVDTQLQHRIRREHGHTHGHPPPRPPLVQERRGGPASLVHERSACDGLWRGGSCRQAGSNGDGRRAPGAGGLRHARRVLRRAADGAGEGGGSTAAAAPGRGTGRAGRRAGCREARHVNRGDALPPHLGAAGPRADQGGAGHAGGGVPGPRLCPAPLKRARGERRSGGAEPLALGKLGPLGLPGPAAPLPLLRGQRARGLPAPR
mmetsp:Transcript_19417/g.61553  ORF Transcript_19417/g.61553 Transcript_19417/m.61553 type:complete len:205 (+) Transcript_19417:496-1110(+)